MTQQQIAGVLVVANIGFWLALLWRMAISRSRGSASQPADASPPRVAQKHIVAPHTVFALVAMSATTVLYYSALILWWQGSPLVGPRMLPDSAAVHAVGVLMLVACLGLMGWTYAVFRSWRFRAEIVPGHELMVDGPFGIVRHPIYSAFALFYFGSFLLVPVPAVLLQALASFAAYDFRSRVEEEVLIQAFGDQYASYRATRKRFFPGLY